MSSTQRRSVTITLLVMITALLVSGPGYAAGQTPPGVKVLISYRTPPGSAEIGAVRRAGGHVRYAYHIVPVIAATVPETAIARLAANPAVTRVEADLPMHALEVFDAEMENAWGVARIGSGEAHDIGLTGQGIRIAIVDSGINRYHPDLVSNYRGGYDFIVMS